MDLSHLKLKAYFATAKEGDYHIYNVPDSNGVVRKEVKNEDGSFTLTITHNGEELGTQKHNMV